MMKNKILALVFACVMAAGLTACGGSNASSAGGSVSEASSSASASASESAGDSSASSASDASASSDAAETEFELGESEGAVYTNEYFGISLTLPDGWSFATDDQLAQLNAAVGNMSDSEAVQEALDNGSTAIDMMAQSADATNNINVVLESANPVAASIVSDEQILDNALSSAESMLENQGASDIQVTRGTVDFCGQTCQSATFSMTISGQSAYESMVLMKKDSYLLLATATTAFEDGTEALLSQFQAI